MRDDNSVTGPTALEDYELPIDEGDQSGSVAGAVHYAFIGSGQGGSRIAAAAYARGYRKTIVVNTALQDLEHIDVPQGHKLHMNVGPGGAGKDVVKGEEAATKHAPDILDLMRRVFGKVDHIMICAGAGGGSGGGSLIPLITIVAKKYMQTLGYVGAEIDQRVGVILSLPRDSECERVVASNAITVAEGVSQLAEDQRISPLLIVDNARIASLYPQLSVGSLWPTVNNGIVHMFDLFNRLPLEATRYSTFDPVDYKTVISAGGHMVMGVTKIKADRISGATETDVSKMLRHSIDKTLIADGFDLKQAKVSAAVVVASEATLDSLPDALTEYIYTMLKSITGGVIHRGIYADDRDDLRIYTIIGGLPRPARRYDRLRALAADNY